MLSIWIIALIVAVIIVFEVPGMVRKKQWRELVAFTLLTVIGSGLSVSNALHYTLPSPVAAINSVFSPMGKWLMAILQ